MWRLDKIIYLKCYSTDISYHLFPFLKTNEVILHKEDWIRICLVIKKKSKESHFAMKIVTKGPMETLNQRPISIVSGYQAKVRIAL